MYQDCCISPTLYYYQKPHSKKGSTQFIYLAPKETLSCLSEKTKAFKLRQLFVIAIKSLRAHWRFFSFSSSERSHILLFTRIFTASVCFSLKILLNRLHAYWHFFSFLLISFSMKSLSHQLRGHLCFLLLFQTDFDSFHVAFTSTISLLFLIEFFCHFSNVEKQTLKEKNKIKKKNVFV